MTGDHVWVFVKQRIILGRSEHGQRGKGDNGHARQVLRANARPVSRWVIVLAVVLGIAAGTWGAVVAAQTAPKLTADQAGPVLEEMIVTGTRIAVPNAVSTSPIQAVSP